MRAAGRLAGRVRDPAEPSAGSPARVVELADGPLGAYVHVPFCARVCPFCPYNKVIPRAGQPERYFEALLAEARGYVAAGAAGATGFTLQAFAGLAATSRRQQQRGTGADGESEQQHAELLEGEEPLDGRHGGAERISAPRRSRRGP